MVTLNIVPLSRHATANQTSDRHGQGGDRRPDDARMREVFDQLAHHLEVRYEIAVVISDVVSPFTGVGTNQHPPQTKREPIS
jgi:hypothetical protein